MEKRRMPIGIDDFAKLRTNHFYYVDKTGMIKELLENSVSILSYLLSKNCGKKCIVIIDEYDVPLQKAEEEGYYKDMVSFISTFFGSRMKSNNNILFSVVTGCLRIARESIFTGFNNPKMHTIVDEQYDEWFGFTDSEVREMLACYAGLKYNRNVFVWWLAENRYFKNRCDCGGACLFGQLLLQ